MREEDTRTKEGAALWLQAREGWEAPSDDETPDALLLAAYLDGRLHEDEAARLEARLAGEPALLDELMALRDSMAVGPEAAPAGVVARAQALRSAKAAPHAVSVAKPSLAARLFGFTLRPALSALAGLALLLACAGAFELGRYQAERFDTTQTAEVSDADLSDDLLMGGLL